MQRILLDPRVLAGALDLVDAVGAAEDQPAVLDRVSVAVERADGRAGGAVALGVVLPAVAGAAEAGRLSGRQLEQLDPGLVGDEASRLVVDRAVRLDRAAEVGAAVRENGEARLAAEQAVVADVGGAARYFARLRILDERRDHELAVREVRQEAEVDVVELLALDRRGDEQADGRNGDDAADQRAEAERRALEELAARVGLARDRGGLGRGFDRRRRTRRRWGRLGMAHARREVAHPEQPEERGDCGADQRHDQWVDDQADENDRDADGETDRPDGRRRQVRLIGALAGLQLRDASFSLSDGIQTVARAPCQRRIS